MNVFLKFIHPFFTCHTVSTPVKVFEAAEALLWICRKLTTPDNPTAWFSEWSWGIRALRKILLWNHHHPQCLQHCSCSLRRRVLADDWRRWEGKFDIQAWGVLQLLHTSWLEGLNCHSTKHQGLSSVVWGPWNHRQMYRRNCLQSPNTPFKGQLVT